VEWVEVTDPTEPLYGRRFRVESISRSPQEVAHVFVRREDGIGLRVPLRSTNLSLLVSDTPRAKLNAQSIADFLSLVKEYELCPPPKTSPPRMSGRRSTCRRDSKS
jgi:hypothetical protein